jgi:monoamine oxidase
VLPSETSNRRCAAILHYIMGLAKAVDAAALGDPVSAEDRERLRAFLKAFALDRDLAYRGSPRSGYVEPPGPATQFGRLHSPLDLRQLLRSEFWHGPTKFGEAFSQAATMLQPVGGMGRIGDALGHRLGTIITYNAEVIALRRSDDDARVLWRDRTAAPSRRPRRLLCCARSRSRC